VVVAGHSLGAGVAALLLARLKNREDKVLAKSRRKMQRKGVNVGEGRDGGGDSNSPLGHHRSVYSCVGFGMPPCVDASFATYLHSDDCRCTSVVNHDDVIPRSSAHNARRLVSPLRAFLSLPLVLPTAPEHSLLTIPHPAVLRTPPPHPLKPPSSRPSLSGP
jgi:hypothetical protein